MSRHAKILLCFCLYDILLTVVGINLMVVREANPTLAFSLGIGGVVALIAHKLLINLLGIFVLEAARSFALLSVAKIERAYKFAIWGQAVIYSILIFLLN